MDSNHTYIPYHNFPVSSLTRVQKVKEKKPDQTKCVTNNHQAALDKAKEYAKTIWSRPDTASTTYGHNYGKKCLDEPTFSRPTSPFRKNNPHPNRVFLVNRTSTCRKEANKFIPIHSNEKLYDQLATGTQHRALLTDSYPETLTDTESHAMTAWLKLANTRDRAEIFDEILNKDTNKTDPNGNRRFAQSQKHRGAMSRLQTTLMTNPDKLPCAPPPQRFPEFCIHPDWPPSLHHHRIHLPDFKSK